MMKGSNPIIPKGIKMSKNYIPPSKMVDRANLRDKNNISVIAPITQVTNTVYGEGFPCGPIPNCNTITTGQVINLDEFVQDIVDNSSTTNNLSNIGLTITSDVNGSSDSTNLTSAVQSLIDSNTDSVTGQAIGHTIATHTAVDNTAFPIKETITALGTPYLTSNVLYIPYTNENGVEQIVNIDLQYLITNNVYIDGVDYDAGTNVLTLTDTLGNTFTIDLSEFSIVATTLPNGDIEVEQEGVLKFTVGRRFNYNDSTGTQVDSTSGNFVTASQGVNADAVIETSQEVDPDTGNTINMTMEGGALQLTDMQVNVDNTIIDVKSDSVVNFNGGDVNHNASTVNNVGSVTNYDSTSTINYNQSTSTYTDAIVDSSGTTYNHTNDFINIDNSDVNITNSTLDLTNTTVEGGTFNNINITGTVTGLVQGITGNIVDNTDPTNPVVTQIQPDWSATSGLGEILNKAVRPDELAGTTTDDSLVVRDTAGTFRDATALDIQSLGFSPVGSGPVQGLDGLAFKNTGNNEYRANYKGETLGTWSEAGLGVWYDNINMQVYVSNDNNVKRYNLAGQLLQTITTSGNKGMLRGDNSERFLITENGSQRIDLDTNVVTGSALGRSCDVSPSGDFFASIINENLNSVQVRKYDSSGLATVSTYTYTFPNAGQALNKVSSATFIDDNNIVLNIYDGAGGGVGASKLISVDLSTNTITNTFAYTYPGGTLGEGMIIYSPSNNLIYYKTGGSGGLYTITTAFTSNTLINLGVGFNPYVFEIYRTSDGSIGGQVSQNTDPTGNTKPLLITNVKNKTWTTFSNVGANRSQIAVIYA